MNQPDLILDSTEQRRTKSELIEGLSNALKILQHSNDPLWNEKSISSYANALALADDDTETFSDTKVAHELFLFCTDTINGDENIQFAGYRVLSHMLSSAVSKEIFLSELDAKHQLSNPLSEMLFLDIIREDPQSQFISEQHNRYAQLERLLETYSPQEAFEKFGQLRELSNTIILPYDPLVAGDTTNISLEMPLDAIPQTHTPLPVEVECVPEDASKKKTSLLRSIEQTLDPLDTKNNRSTWTSTSIHQLYHWTTTNHTLDQARELLSRLRVVVPGTSDSTNRLFQTMFISSEFDEIPVTMNIQNDNENNYYYSVNSQAHRLHISSIVALRALSQAIESSPFSFPGELLKAFVEAPDNTQMAAGMFFRLLSTGAQKITALKLLGDPYFINILDRKTVEACYLEGRRALQTDAGTYSEKDLQRFLFTQEPAVLIQKLRTMPNERKTHFLQRTAAEKIRARLYLEKALPKEVIQTLISEIFNSQNTEIITLYTDLLSQKMLTDDDIQALSDGITEENAHFFIPRLANILAHQSSLSPKLLSIIGRTISFTSGEDTIKILYALSGKIELPESLIAILAEYMTNYDIRTRIEAAYALTSLETTPASIIPLIRNQLTHESNRMWLSYALLSAAKIVTLDGDMQKEIVQAFRILLSAKPEKNYDRVRSEAIYESLPLLFSNKCSKETIASCISILFSKDEHLMYYESAFRALDSLVRKNSIERISQEALNVLKKHKNPFVRHHYALMIASCVETNHIGDYLDMRDTQTLYALLSINPNLPVDALYDVAWQQNKKLPPLLFRVAILDAFAAREKSLTQTMIHTIMGIVQKIIKSEKETRADFGINLNTDKRYLWSAIRAISAHIDEPGMKEACRDLLPLHWQQIVQFNSKKA